MTARPQVRLLLAGGLVLAAGTGCGLLGGEGSGSSWEEQAAAIEGIVNYRVERPDAVIPEHVAGQVFYDIRPPVGGQHYDTWYDCNGAVYPAALVDEHAVHSLEHGAVWITYLPGLPAEQIELLAARVRDTEKMMMSPYPGQESPISLQAWGYQLMVDGAADERIDAFIRALRVNASPEGPTAPCTGGTAGPG